MELNVHVEQTTNKHTRAYYKNNTIIIRLAKGLSAAKKVQHTQELVKRMKQKIVHNPKRTTIAPFSHIHQAQVSYIPLTNNKTLTIHMQIGTKNYTKLLDDYTVHCTNHNQSQTQITAKLWKALSTMSTPYFTERIHTLNKQTYAIHISNIKVGHRLTAWGSMSSTGVLRVNPALLFVPEHLRDYVLLHELAHGKEQNHSAKFWAQVARFLPDYKRHVKELKGYALQ